MPVIIDGTLGVNAAAVTTTNWNPTNLSIPGNATIGDASSDTLIINGSSVTFAGTATRIKADFSNDTVANQALFQTTGTNYSTQLRAIPNGTGGQSGFFFYGSSDIDNSSWGAIRTVAGVDVRIQSHTSGSGTLLPITFMTGTTERLRIDTAGNVGIGATAPYDSTTDVLTVKRAQTTSTQIVIDNQSSDVAASSALSLSSYGGGWKVAVPSSTTFTNPLTFSFTGSEKFRIDSSGQAMLGTTTPKSIFTVYQTTAPAITIAKSGDVGSGFQLGRDASTLNAFIIQRENADLFFRTNNAERMRITNNGQVLVGMSSPKTYGTTLNVNGSINTTAGDAAGSSSVGAYDYNALDSTPTWASAIIRKFGPNAAGSMYVVGTQAAAGWAEIGAINTNGLALGSNNGPVLIGSSGVERMRIDGSGNVMAGTTSPLTKFTVNGYPSQWGLSGGRSQRIAEFISIGTNTTKTITLYLNDAIYELIDIRLSGYAGSGAGACNTLWMCGGHTGNGSVFNIQTVFNYNFGSMVVSGLTRNSSTLTFTVQNTSTTQGSSVCLLIDQVCANGLLYVGVA